MTNKAPQEIKYLEVRRIASSLISPITCDPLTMKPRGKERKGRGKEKGGDKGEGVKRKLNIRELLILDFFFFFLAVLNFD